ncbi:MAG: hypothetical protein WDM90_22180 [Ferruginibacter sp.]
MKATIIFCVIILSFSGCSLNGKLTSEKNLQGTWRLYDITLIQTDPKGGDSFSETAALKKMVKDGDVLSFFKDESYYEISGEGKYKTGNWHFTEKDASLSFIDSGKATAAIMMKIEKNEMGKEILSLPNTAKNLLLKYIKESDPLKEFTEDPFYKNNNEWRIKPSHTEDSVQLIKRLSNYIKQLACVLKAAKERKQEVVSFEYSLGPVKIYNGGIGVHPYNILPDSWKNCFYNEADALKAYGIYEKYLATSRYRGAGTGDWIEDDYNILLTIYSGITAALPKGN